MLSKLLKSKVSVRATWRLWLSVTVVLIALFASINYQNSVLHWFVYTLFFIFSGSLIYTLIAVANVKHVWSYKRYLFEGDTADIKLEIENTTPYGIVFNGADYLDVSQQFKVGKHTLKKLILFTEYPYGYFKAHIPLNEIGPIWVYPKPVEHRVVSNNTQANAPTDLFRPYRPGDSPRRVLKKTMALPHEKWQSKKDASESGNNSDAELNWHTLGDTLSASEKLEYLSFLINEMPLNKRFSVILPTFRVRVGSGNAHKHDAWKALTETWLQLNL